MTWEIWTTSPRTQQVVLIFKPWTRKVGLCDLTTWLFGYHSDFVAGILFCSDLMLWGFFVFCSFSNFVAVLLRARQMVNKITILWWCVFFKITIYWDTEYVSEEQKNIIILHHNVITIMWGDVYWQDGWKRWWNDAQTERKIATWQDGEVGNAVTPDDYYSCQALPFIR